LQSSYYIAMMIRQRMTCQESGRQISTSYHKKSSSRHGQVPIFQFSSKCRDYICTLTWQTCLWPRTDTLVDVSFAWASTAQRCAFPLFFFFLALSSSAIGESPSLILSKRVNEEGLDSIVRDAAPRMLNSSRFSFSIIVLPVSCRSSRISMFAWSLRPLDVDDPIRLSSDGSLPVFPPPPCFGFFGSRGESSRTTLCLLDEGMTCATAPLLSSRLARGRVGVNSLLGGPIAEGRSGSEGW